VSRQSICRSSNAQKVFVTTINLFFKATLVVFDTVDQAKDWLVS
jgi:hypothetical protein